MLKNIPMSTVKWEPCWRIIPSKFPPIDLFERVTEPKDLDAVIALESLTNDRLRDEVGDINLVLPNDRITGPGSSYIMAAFTHLNPQGSRFSDGHFGVYYTANRLETAIAETKYHRSLFLSYTNQDACEIDMRVLKANLSGQLYDIRTTKGQFKAYYHPTDYRRSQVLGAELKTIDANGIVYRSVRDERGECAAILRPKLISKCQQSAHLCYVWNGVEITDVYQKSLVETYA